jgi:hypothetical protein
VCVVWLELGKAACEGNVSSVGDAAPLCRRAALGIREAVCKALQRWGDVDEGGALRGCARVGPGSLWKRRECGCGVCESRLLIDRRPTRCRALDLLDGESRLPLRKFVGGAGRRLVPGAAVGGCWRMSWERGRSSGSRSSKPLIGKWVLSDDEAGCAWT